MRESGVKIRSMAKVDMFIQEIIIIREGGWRMKRAERECITSKRECIMEIGIETCEKV